MNTTQAAGFNERTITMSAVPHLAEPDLVALFEHVGAAIATRFKGRHVLNSWAMVLDYLNATLALKPVEHFRVLYLDKRNHLIADEEAGVGTVDHVPVYPREVMKRALELNACAMILVHNHPSGDPTPSRGDIEMTKQIIEAAKIFGITIHDHIIIGRDGHTSFKTEGLI